MNKFNLDKLAELDAKFAIWIKYDNQYTDTLAQMRTFPEYNDDEVERSPEFLLLQELNQRAHQARMNNHILQPLQAAFPALSLPVKRQAEQLDIALEAMGEACADGDWELEKKMRAARSKIDLIPQKFSTEIATKDKEQ